MAKRRGLVPAFRFRHLVPSVQIAHLGHVHACRSSSRNHGRVHGLEPMDTFGPHARRGFEGAPLLLSLRLSLLLASLPRRSRYSSMLFLTARRGRLRGPLDEPCSIVDLSATRSVAESGSVNSTATVQSAASAAGTAAAAAAGPASESEETSDFRFIRGLTTASAPFLVSASSPPNEAAAPRAAAASPALGPQPRRRRSRALSCARRLTCFRGSIPAATCVGPPEPSSASRPPSGGSSPTILPSHSRGSAR